MSDETKLLEHLYDRFNARDMAAILAVLHTDVVWANGMDGGHVQGHDGVRGYWTRQWALIDPRVEPMRFAPGAQSEIAVTAHQTVRDLQGRLLSDKVVGHVFRIEDRLVRRFDIRMLP